MMLKGLVISLMFVLLIWAVHADKKDKQQKCLPDTKDGINWPETEPGKTAVMPCPEGQLGNATRYCRKMPGKSQKGKWNKVNLEQCESNKNKNKNKNKKGDSLEKSCENSNQSCISSLESLLDELNMKTGKSNKNLNSSVFELKRLARILKQSNKSNAFFSKRENVKKILNTASNLLDPANVQSWLELQGKDSQDNPIINLVTTLDSIGLLLAQTLNTTNKTLVIKTKNVAVKINVIVPGAQEFANFTYQQSSISLPPELFSATEPSTEVTVIYLTLNEILKLPVFMTANTTHNDNATINVTSTIVSSTITPRRTTPTKSFVKIVLANKEKFQLFNSTMPVCVSWNPESRIRAWTDEGCHVVHEETDADKTTCACNHLTLFTSFMDPHQLPISDIHIMALDFISFIGCSISLLAVTATFITIVSQWTKLKSLRMEVLLNICIAIGSVCFLVLIEQPARDNKVTCKLMSILLHYFLLTAFAWMFNEGFLLYLLVIKVDKTRLSQNIKRPLYYFGWGFPLLLLAISLWATELRGYGDQAHICWLTVENGVVWAFVAPALVVIVINLYVLCKIINRIKKSQRLRGNTNDGINASVRATVITMPLLGVTWLFGVLMFHNNLTAIKYIFAVLNSLQGSFIFIFHCLLDRQVRKAIKLSISRRKRAKRTAPVPTIQVKPCVIYKKRTEEGQRFNERRKACIDHAVIHL